MRNLESAVDPALKRRLDDAGVDFCLIGAAALAAHGYSRSTSDVDLLVLDPAVLMPAFWGDVAVKLRIGNLEDPLTGSVFIPGPTPYDVVVGKTYAAKLALQTSQRNEVLGVKVARVLPLALMKFEAGSAQDVYDVMGLIERRTQLGDTAWIDELPQHLQRLTPEGRDAYERMQLVLQRSKI
jgi:hypothetical protein